MHCKQASEMMSARLDGCLESAEAAHLEDHLVACSACQAEWHRLQALDRLLNSARTMQAPVRVRVQVMARLARRDQARRAIIGGTALTLGAVALALLALAPALLGLLDTLGIAPALISGGPATLAQLASSWRAMERTLALLAEQFVIPLIFAGMCGLVMILALNSLWIGAIRRLRASR